VEGLVLGLRTKLTRRRKFITLLAAVSHRVAPERTRAAAGYTDRRIFRLRFAGTESQTRGRINTLAITLNHPSAAVALARR